MSEPIRNPARDADAEFRKERVWTSFKAVLYSGLSAACFLGVINKLVDTAVKAVETGGASFSSPLALGVMGGFMAVGTLFTYLAQREWTDVKCIEDERLARKNAECMGKTPVLPALPEHGADVSQEFEGKRADGKSWLQVVVQHANDVASGVHF
jgi:hypothetical protein